MSSGTWVVEEIAGNVEKARRSRKGQVEVCRWFYLDFLCKDQWWVPNICSEEFQHVGRTIFIKSKVLLFPYKLIISTGFSNFFYQVMILLKRGNKTNYEQFDFRKTLIQFIYLSFFLCLSLVSLFYFLYLYFLHFLISKCISSLFISLWGFRIFLICLSNYL